MNDTIFEVDAAVTIYFARGIRPPTQPIIPNAFLLLTRLSEDCEYLLRTHTLRNELVLLAEIFIPFSRLSHDFIE